MLFRHRSLLSALPGAMSSQRVLASLCLLLILPLVASVSYAQTQAEAFVVEDIRIEGLQRISEGTLLTYLPITVGDKLSTQDVQNAIRSVYSSGFFHNVTLLRDDNVLLVKVQERPSISSFSLKGNEDIDSDILLDSLRNMGLAEGRIFNRSTLDRVKQELTRQYHSRGKYGVEVETFVDELPNNLVAVQIDVNEGDVASIRQINIVGNSIFNDELLLETFELKATNWTSAFDSDDAYSQEKLTGDLENLESYYMNRGYADFGIKSTQVSISPTLEDMFLTVNIHEGEIYKIDEVKFVGDLVIPEQTLRDFILIPEGSTFSMARATAIAEYLKNLLGNRGYGFAEVTPYPQVELETNKVDVVFLIEPGRITYVNEIRFLGDTGTLDEIFRREMRQFEGTWYINSKVERSKIRLTRLPFIENVTYESVPVPGHPDLIDLEYTIKQRQAGNFLFSVGYGSEIGVILNAGISHSNFLGTGDRVALNLSKTTFRESYSVSHTDPYFTIDGISRRFSAFYTKSESFIRNASNLDTTYYGADLSFGIPFSEYTGARVGLGVRHTQLLSNIYTSQELLDFIQNNGSPYQTLFGPATEFETYELSLGYYRDTRNRVIFASRGALSQVKLDVALPGSGVQYYTLAFKHTGFVPLPLDLTLGFNGEIAFGKQLGDTTVLPPYKNFYAGGPDTVRSYRDNYLGPLDSRGLPLGGAMRTYLQTQLIFPPPGEGGGPGAIRFSLFFDVGNVYATPSDFEASELRASTGVAVVWLSPLGAMRFSLGTPIWEQPGDRTETFQFSVGSTF